MAMKISARNNLKGKVVSVEHGTVNSVVTIEVAEGVQLVSMITRESARELELEVGREVYALVKASNVMVGVD